MKINLTKISFLLFTSVFCFGNIIISQCQPAGITTDPDDPVNNQNSNYINDFFDWRTEHFQVNSNFIGATQVLSPYSPNLNNNSNTLELSNNVDNSPSDGWELIAWDMGFDEDGNAENPPAGNIHFILYNKYTSILRIFVAGQDNNAYNAATITFSLISGSSNPNRIAQPSLIQDPNYFTGLDNHNSQPLQSASNFLNGLVSNWFYADFYINYDPCVCFYESRMEFTVKHISNSSINISGAFNGQVTQISNGLGSTNNGYTFKFQDLIDGGQKAYKKYKTLNKFVEDQEKAAGIFQKPEGDLTPDELKKKEAYSKFQQFMSEDNVIQFGLNFVPYVGPALELVKFFVGKSKSSTPDTPKSMAINATLDLQGTISTVNDYITPSYYTPGSYNSNQSTSQYPYYNEVLGVFNLIETPKIKYNYSYLVALYGSVILDNNPNNLYIRNVDRIIQTDEMEFENNELKYTLNPALGLTEDDYEILGSLSFESNEILTETPYQLKENIYETDMYPLNCLFNTKFKFGGTTDVQFDFLNGNLVQDSVVETSISEVGLGKKLPTDFSYVQYVNAAPFNSFDKALNIFLKIYVSIKLPNGSRALHVLTYPLDVLTGQTLNKPETNNSIKPFLMIDEPIEIPTGLGNFVLEANNVLITSDAVLGALGTSSLTIRAMNEINVLPDAIINPNVVLEVVPKQSCYSLPVNVMQPSSAVTTFCQSSSYKDIRNKNTLQVEEQPVIEEGDFTFNLFPNPTTDNTWMTYQISEESTVKIVITDLAGKIIEYSAEIVQSQGDYKVQLTTADLPKGFYLCALTVNGITQTKTLIIQ